jgi:hypothetical protein
MTHVRKLQLTGEVCGRNPTKRVQSYYSWPKGERQEVVESLIKNYRRAFCNVTVWIQHNYID